LLGLWKKNLHRVDLVLNNSKTKIETKSSKNKDGAKFTYEIMLGAWMSQCQDIVVAFGYMHGPTTYCSLFLKLCMGRVYNLSLITFLR